MCDHVVTDGTSRDTKEGKTEMTFIDMAGLDWEKAPDTGIYLMGHDTSVAQVASGGGGLLRSQKIKGWTGKFLPGDVRTSAEAIGLAGLDWVVDRRPIVQVQPVYGVPTKTNPSGITGWDPVQSFPEKVNGMPNGGYAVAPSHVMNVRRDTGQVLGVVGHRWAGPQNDETFKFLDSLVDDDEAKYLAGGSVDGGKKIWICCQLDREIILGGDQDERSIPLMFVSNGWDGGTSYSITTAPYRLACMNGQTIPLEGFVRTWKARHTSGLTADGKLQEARKALKLSIGYFDAWAEEMEKLMTQHISTQEVERLIVKLLPDPKPAGQDGNLTDRQIKAIDGKRHEVLSVYQESPSLQNLGGTKYRFINAVTEYADWHTKCDVDEQVIRSAEPSKMKDLAYALVTA